MKKFIDLHCHPYKRYFENPSKILEEAKNAGVEKVFLVGYDLESSKEAISISQNHNFTFPIIGIHPTDVWNLEHINLIKQMANKKVVGIGEVGIDLHYDNSPSLEHQEKAFKMQIEIAIKKEIPVIVHSRDAAQETYQIIKEYKEKHPNLIFIMHSYSYGVEWVEKFIEITYLSFSGIVTFSNAKDMQNACKLTPIEKMFYETDTPYLAPTPHRGKQNKPIYVIETAKFIANLKGISLDYFLEQVSNNLKKAFPKLEHYG